MPTVPYLLGIARAFDLFTGDAVHYPYDFTPPPYKRGTGPRLTWRLSGQKFRVKVCSSLNFQIHTLPDLEGMEAC